jgi:disulfide bond formation protein DsbB
MDLAAYTWNVTDALSMLIVVGNALLVILACNFAWATVTRRRSAVIAWFATHGLTLMLIVALTATLGSLYFSEIAQWAPCKYCWIQRILMYPQVILLGIALWKHDRNVAHYVLALSLIGLAFAAYHYYIQMYDIIASPLNPATPCDASGESCVKTPFVKFGYITIPFMALTAFALNGVGSLLMLQRTKA